MLTITEAPIFFAGTKAGRKRRFGYTRYELYLGDGLEPVAKLDSSDSAQNKKFALLFAVASEMLAALKAVVALRLLEPEQHKGVESVIAKAEGR